MDQEAHDAFIALEERNHKERMAQFKKKRNLLSPVSRLPAELVIIILQMLQEEVASPRSLGLQRMTRVYSRWRIIALGCPSLWTDIDFKLCPSMIEALLKRTGRHALLDINIPPRLRRWGLAGKTLESEAFRIKTLHVTGDFLSVVTQLRYGMPSLTHLELQNDSSAGFWAMLPSQFLEGGAPRLRHLSLTNMAPRYWNSPIIVSLTHLKVQLLHRWEYAHGHTMDTIFDALEHMPGLVDLDLAMDIPDRKSVV